MFKFKKKQATATEQQTNKETANLTDTQIRLRAGFYEEDQDDTNSSEIARMLAPKMKAHVLYKELAKWGEQQGWIKDSKNYPLMYELLYNAADTALAVDWRFQNRVSDDDSQHSKALTLSLVWCAYIAMADVYLCYKDWERLRSRGLVYLIEDICGFDHADEYAAEQLGFMDQKDLRMHLLQLSVLAKKPFTEANSTAVFAQRKESLTAMYFYGMTLAMQKLNLL